MARIKISEEQANMLKEMGKTKVLKVTQEQYNKILEMENSISEKNLSSMGKTMVKQANPIDRPQMTRDLKKNLPEMYEKFINELYGVSESTEKVYEKLHKLMEGAGLIANGKLVKEKFNGDKERVKQVINAGLYEMACGGSAYKAMEAIEEAINNREDIINSLKSQLSQEPKRTGKSREELIAAIKKKREESKDITAQKEKEREEALKALANRENEDKLEEAGDYPAGAEYDPSAPWNQKDPDYRGGERVEGDYEVIGYNGEVAILKNKKGNLFTFYYYDMDNSEFEPYADIEREYVGKDEDGMPDYDYADEFDIDGDVISSYVNDNIGSMSVGQGLGDFESGADLTLIDDELKNDLLSVYSDLEGVLKNTNEATMAGSAGAFVAPLGSDPRFKSNVPEEIDEQGIGSVGAYDTPGFASSEFMGTKGKKGKAPVNKGVTHKKTMRPDYKFVTIKDKCNEFPYCDQGPDAISINESLYEEIAKKTNRTIEDVKKIINNKNK